MVSDLPPIYEIGPRVAESSGTHDGVRRQQDNTEGRNKGRGFSRNAEKNSEDLTEVSIEALIIFLRSHQKSLLRGQPNNIEGFTYQDAHQDDLFSYNNAPSDTQPRQNHLKAANAYTRTAKALRNTKSYKQIAQESGKTTSTNETIRIIHSLLKALGNLQDREIFYIRIEKGGSFLDSIEPAIADYHH